MILFSFSNVVAAAYTIDPPDYNEEVCEGITDTGDETPDLIEEAELTEDELEDTIIQTKEVIREEAVLEEAQEAKEEQETEPITENTNITVFSGIGSFSELQNAIENAPTTGEETVIHITSNIIEFEKAISVEGGRNITIQTDPAMMQAGNHGNLSILEMQSVERHFLVTGGSRLTIENVVLRGNRDGGNLLERDAIGGGILVDGENTSLVMTGRNTEILLCFAEQGGAVELRNGATFTMNNGIISRNRATHGAGIYLGNDTKFIMGNGMISGNDATSRHWTGYGGGLFLAENSKLLKEGGTIITNSASNNGGGIYISSQSEANITGVISNNIAIRNGGGVYMNDESEVKITGEIKNNGAHGLGGGIYTEDYHILTTASSTEFERNWIGPGGNNQLASPFRGRASDFPNIGFASVSQSFEGYMDHPINNRDINSNLEYEIDDRPDTIYHHVTVQFINFREEEIHHAITLPMEDRYHFNVKNIVTDTPIDLYQALHYVVEEDEGREEHALTVKLEITEDTTITIYHISTVMTVTIPNDMEFFANQQTGGAVFSRDYEVINHSDLPVKIHFTELRYEDEEDLDGINLVGEATNGNDLHLNIHLHINELIGSVRNIVPDYIHNEKLGSLGGEVIGENDRNGSFSISGQYIGNLTTTPKSPEVQFLFTFELDKEEIQNNDN